MFFKKVKNKIKMKVSGIRNSVAPAKASGGQKSKLSKWA